MIKKIGEGAFGAVFSGVLKLKHEKIPVAVKTLKCDSVTKDKIEEIMSEARLMRRFNHRNVVKCYGVAAEIEPVLKFKQFTFYYFIN